MYGHDDGLLDAPPQQLLSPRVRRLVLCLGLLVVGLHGLMRSIVIIPSCANGEIIDVCGSGTDGQNAATSTVTMTSCTSQELDFVGYLMSITGAEQVGFGSNLKNPAACQLYGCATHQCLKTTTQCNQILPTVTNECVSGHNVSDLQPFPGVVCIGFIVLSIAMFFGKRPLDPTNGRIAGIAILVFVTYNLAMAITIVKSCPWGDQTYSQCKTTLPNAAFKNQSQVVSLSDCNAAPGMSPFATNLPRSSGSGCQLYGCGAKECIKSSFDCTTGKTNYECVSGQGAATVQPVLLFFDLALLGLGAWFLLRPHTPLDWRRIMGLVLVVYFFHHAGSTVLFLKGCSNSAPSVCGSGQKGQVKNSHQVSMTKCYTSGYLAPSPFATNLQPVDNCLQLECGPNHCLQETQTCNSAGFPSGDSTYECVLQRGTGVAAPLTFMFDFVFVFLGAFLYLRGGAPLKTSAVFS